MTTNQTIGGVPRGEPVYQVSDGVNGWSDVDLLRYTACCLDPEEYECRVLYAEHPAPVAPPPINYGALDPVERLAVCRGEVAPVAVPHLEMSHVVRAHMDIPGCPVLTSNQCHTLAMKLNACLDELKLLNPSL